MPGTARRRRTHRSREHLSKLTSGREKKEERFFVFVSKSSRCLSAPRSQSIAFYRDRRTGIWHRFSFLCLARRAQTKRATSVI